jgi:hypothetical protein
MKTGKRKVLARDPANHNSTCAMYDSPVSVVLGTAEQDNSSKQGKGGRPTKYEPETVERLLAALADGLNIKQACLAAGVGESTLARWREEHHELEPRLMEARETARRKALAGIKAAGESGDWRAYAEFLRLSFPQDYRQAGTKIDVTASAIGQQATGVLITPEDRKALREQRQRLLMENGNPQDPEMGAPS